MLEKNTVKTGNYLISGEWDWMDGGLIFFIASL